MKRAFSNYKSFEWKQNNSEYEIINCEHNEKNTNTSI